MTAIRVDNFGGLIPRLSNRLLPPNFGVTATNCKLFSGELRGWNKSTLLTQLTPGYAAAKAHSVLYNGSALWLTSQYDETHWVEAPLINDAYDRVYWSNGANAVPKYNTKARLYAGDPDYYLGIPAPTLTMTVTPDGSGTALEVTRAYVFTYVSIYGEESAPSDPVLATGARDDQWDLANLGTNIGTDMPSSSNRAMTSAATKRIYRTITSTTGQTTFFFVAEINVNTGTYADTSSDEDIAFNELLPSSGWDVPPTTLEGMLVHSNGFLVGFSGSDIYLSEPYRPHAWPSSYVISTDSEILGLGISGTTIGIVTKSNPYTLTGTHPASMVFTKSDAVEPGLSKQGIVSLSNGVYYPSQNGLVFLTSSGAQVITKNLTTRDEWATDYSPNTIQATRYGTSYLAMTSANNGFLFNPEEEKSAITKINTTDPIDHAFTDKNTGNVYLLISNSIYTWDPLTDSIPIVYEWKSKVFEFTKPLNMAAGMVKLDDSAFTIDPDYLTSLEAVNTLIAADISATAPISAFNSRTFNGVRPRASYKTALNAAGYLQRRAFNSTDFIDVSEISSLAPTTIVKVWADATLVFSYNVADNTIFRLPGGFKAHTWQFSITSNTDVYSIALASTAKGLMEA